MAIFKMKWGSVDVICWVSFAVLFGSTLLTPCCTQEGGSADSTKHELPDSPMWPSNPIVEVGNNLTLNCTLGQMHAANYTARDLFFKLGNTTIDSKYIHVVDQYTAMLNLPMTTKTNVHAFCYARGKDEIMIGQQNVIAGRKPLKPNITGCVVDNWEKMTCTWTPTKEEQDNYTGLATRVELHWTILGDKPSNNCPHSSSNSCSWKRPDGEFSLKFMETYKLKLETENDLGNEFSAMAIVPKQIVRPNPVTNIELVDRNSTSLSLSWNPPASRQILYKVSYTCQWYEEAKVINVTSPHVTLLGLYPHTDYDINISGIPMVRDEAKGFWSQQKAVTKITDVDVPAALPKLSPGGFLGRELDNNMWEIELFWKPVPKIQMNGEVDKYLVKLTSEGRAPILSRVRGDTSSTSLILEQNLIHNVSLQVKTLKGYNYSLTPVPITIPVYNEVPSKPENFVVISLNETHFNLSWNPVLDVEQYTVYWCKGSHTDMKCEEDLNTKNVDRNTTQLGFFDVSPMKRNFVIIAISAEKLTGDGTIVSSGMEPSQCFYVNGKDVKKPDDFRKADHQHDESFSVEWTKPKCSETGYIQMYRVYYCKKENCFESNDTVDVLSYLDPTFTKYGLKPDVEYEIWMTSVSRNGIESASTERISIKTFKSGLTTGGIVGIFIGSLFLLVMVLIGSYAIYKKLHKTAKERLGNVPIKRYSISSDDCKFQEHSQLRNGYDEEECPELSPNPGYDVPTAIQNYQNQKLEDKFPVSNGHVFQRSPSVATGDYSVTSVETTQTVLPGESHDDQLPLTPKDRHPSQGSHTELPPVAEESAKSCENESRIDDYTKVTQKDLSDQVLQPVPGNPQYRMLVSNDKPVDPVHTCIPLQTMRVSDAHGVPKPVPGQVVTGSTVLPDSSVHAPSQRNPIVDNRNNGNNNPAGGALRGSNSSMSSNNSDSAYQRVGLQDEPPEVTRTGSDQDMRRRVNSDTPRKQSLARPLSEPTDGTFPCDDQIPSRTAPPGYVTHPPAPQQHTLPGNSKAPKSMMSSSTVQTPLPAVNSTHTDPGGYVTEIPNKDTSQLNKRDMPEDKSGLNSPQQQTSPGNSKAPKSMMSSSTVQTPLPAVNSTHTDPGGYVTEIPNKATSQLNKRDMPEDKSGLNSPKTLNSSETGYTTVGLQPPVAHEGMDSSSSRSALESSAHDAHAVNPSTQGYIPVNALTNKDLDTQGETRGCSTPVSSPPPTGYVPISAVSNPAGPSSEVQPVRGNQPPFGYVSEPPTTNFPPTACIPETIPLAKNSESKDSTSIPGPSPSGYVPFSAVVKDSEQGTNLPQAAHVPGETAQDGAYVSSPLPVTNPQGYVLTPPGHTLPGKQQESVPSPTVPGSTNSIPIKINSDSAPFGGYVTEEDIKNTHIKPGNQGYVPHDAMGVMVKQDSETIGISQVEGQDSIDSGGNGAVTLPPSISDLETEPTPVDGVIVTAQSPANGQYREVVDPSGDPNSNGYVSHDSEMLNNVPSTPGHS